MSSPGSLSPERAAALVEAIGVNRTVNYVALISVTIIFFDYLHTFPREVNLMWKSKLTITKSLYFVLRYYIMVHSLLWVLVSPSHYTRSKTMDSADSNFWADHADHTLTGPRCNFPFSRNSASSQVVLVLCEAISYVRVYAFSGRNRKVLAFLVVHFIAVNAVSFYYIARLVTSVSFLSLPAGWGLGCFPAKADGFALTMVGVTLIVSYTSASIAMVVIGIRRHSSLSGKNKLIRVLYQDGISYFFCLSALSVANISVFHLAPENGVQLIVVQPQVHFSALIATRMLLHLREWSAKQQIVIASEPGGSIEYPVDLGSPKFSSRDSYAMSERAYPANE